MCELFGIVLKDRSRATVVLIGIIAMCSLVIILFQNQEVHAEPLTYVEELTVKQLIGEAWTITGR